MKKEFREIGLRAGNNPWSRDLTRLESAQGHCQPHVHKHIHTHTHKMAQAAAICTGFFNCFTLQEEILTGGEA